MFLYKISRSFFIVLLLLYTEPSQTADQSYKRDDPAFFRFKVNHREFYILGTPHTIPLHKMYSHNTLEEIKKIAKQKAILYSEHLVTNKTNLDYFNNSENLIPEESFEEGNNLFSSLGIKLSQKEEKILKENKIMVSHGVESNKSLYEILKARLWLGAVTLGTHSSILSYAKFGGTEEGLIEGELKGEWGEILYLETPEKVIEILKNNKDSGPDSNQNQSWVKKSFEKILLIEAGDQQSIKLAVGDQQKRSIENHSWKVITYIDRTHIPDSVVARNRLWVDVVFNKLQNITEHKNPILITIGDGHIAGFPKGFSFIYLLMQKLGVHKLERFSSEQNRWIAYN